MNKSTKIVLFRDKGTNKEGKYPVKIRVISERRDRYFRTGVYIFEQDFPVLHQKKALKEDFKYLNYCLEKADKIIKDLGYNFSWTEFKKRFYNKESATSKDQTNDLLGYLTEKEKKLRKAGKIKTARTYDLTRKHVEAFTRKKEVPFLAVTPEFLTALENYLLYKHKSGNNKKTGLSYSSIGIDMRNIRSVYNDAIVDGVIDQKLYPFGRRKYIIPATKKAKKALNIEDIQKLYEYKPEDGQSSEARSLDMWFFAYFSNGMNMKDIAFLKYKNVDWQQEKITFYREKTRESRKYNLQPIEVVLTEESKAIINKWGRKPKRPDTFIFPILHPNDLSPEQIYRDVDQATKTVNKYLKRIALELHLEKIPTTNFARHSYSTVLKRAGVPIEMISELLGHSSIKTTQIYLDSFEMEQKIEVSKHLTAFKIDKREDKA